MNSTPERDEWLRLFSELANGTLSEQERGRLEAVLKENPEARRLWFQSHDIELGVADWAAAQGGFAIPNVQAMATKPRATWPLPLWTYGLSAALVAFLFIAGLLTASVANRGRKGEAPIAAAPSTAYMATLAGENDCVWNGAPLRIGQRISPGVIKLSRGQALINFDGGARLALAGPAEIVIESAGSARLVSGKVAVRAPDEAAGFKITTTEGTLVDLGTEFVLSANAQGETECQVLDGEVQWRPAEGSQKVALLTEGEARRFTRGAAETIEASPAHYRDFLPSPAVGAAAGKLLAYEPFDYPATEAPAESLNGGTGWKSPWRGRFISTDTVDIDPIMHILPGQTLPAPPGMKTSPGGSLVFHDQKQWRLRALPLPVDFGRDGVYYVSCLARRDRESAVPGVKNGRMTIDFRCSTNYWEHWIGFGISSSNQPMIIADGNNRWSDQKVPVGETLLMVCKIATSRTGPDQLFMKVYSPGEEVEPEETARWTVVSPDLHLDTAMDYIVLGAWGGVQWTIGDLRYGTSWTAVAVRNEETPNEPGSSK